jgi:superfamily II DNA helicase RecQ
MHSYADQKTHDFFLNRDYPPVNHLEQIHRALSADPQAVDELREGSRLDEEEFDKALEKLQIHGGALVDFGGNVTVGRTGWKKTYAVQAQFRAEQFEKVLRYTTSSECRMAALVRHFGDVEDAVRPCGICDVCDPAGAVLRLFRRATPQERAWMQQIADELRPVDYKAAGTLQRNLGLAETLSRNEFDVLLGAMVQAGLIAMEEAEYEKDGEVRRFRKVRLTEAGLELRATTAVEILISDGVVEEFGGRPAAPARAYKTKAAAKPGKAAVAAPVRLTAEDEALAARLREWRAAEARRLGVPAYLVLHDRSLTALAHARPGNPNQLLAIDGIGPAKVEKFGEAILELCAATE